MGTDGNLIVMGDGKKQLVPRYSFSLEPTGSANGLDMGGERRREH